MSRMTCKALIVFLSYLLPSLAIGANMVQSTIINAEQDSMLAHFHSRIQAAGDDSIKCIEIYYEFGQYFDLSGNTDESIKQFIKALRIAKSTNSYCEIAKIGNYLANMYAAIGDFTTSNNTYLLALENAENCGDNGEIAKISMNLASNYNYTGDYPDAIKYGLYALKIKETNRNLNRICYHYIAMGNIFRENNNNDKWEEYVLKAYEMKDIEGCASLSDCAKIYNSLGGIAVQKKEYHNALRYYDTLQVLSKEANYDQGLCSSLTNSAGVYKQLDNFDKALELCTEAEQYFGSNPYDKIFNNNFKAELFNLTGRFREGLALLTQNIATPEINYYSTEKLKCLELLYELNFNMENYNSAFYWNDSLRKTENVLRNADIRKSLEELETKYETEKKEQKIELLTAENVLKNQRIKASVGIVFILLIVIILIIYIFSIRKRQAELLQNNLQLQVLRAQMNPHFIFNVLGSIQNFMMQNDLRKASDFLSRFATLTRATLTNSVAENISLADEINMLKDYIELERMRKGNRFEYRIEYDDELEIDLIKIPPMIVQPFIENSIKHGFGDIISDGLLRLQISDKIEWIEFVIEDNGQGIQQNDEKIKDHQSMAMLIFEKRRKLIQQKYKKDFKFELLNLKDINPDLSGVKITINIPILNDD